MAPRTDFDLNDFFPYLINRVGVALVATFGADPLGRYDLSIAMWRVLAALSANGGQRLVDLAAMTSVDVSTLSRMITRLVRLDLVQRTRSKTSEREIAVALTAKGRRVLTDLIPIALRFEDALIGGIAQSDLAVMKRVLHQMHQNMTRFPAPAVKPRR